MTPKIYTKTENATARLFLLEELLSENIPTIIITDSPIFESLCRYFTGEILPKNMTFPDQIGQLLRAIESEEKTIFAHTDIFRSAGNLHHIQKTQNIRFVRGEIISPEDAIKRLLDAGYSHDAFEENPHSYHREGGTIKIREKNPLSVFEIEWFDREIDSILHFQKNTLERKFLDSLTLSTHKNEENSSEKIEEKSINIALLSEISQQWKDYRIILVGADFLPEKSFFLEKSDIHLSELNSTHGEEIGAEKINIQHIDEILPFLQTQKKNTIPVKIFTRYHEALTNFLENNGETMAEIFPTESRKIESFIMKNEHEKLQKMAVLSDDIIGKIFVKKRKSQSIAKNLDLLISLLPGDYVVHRDHGIGLFVAMVKKKLGDLEREYLEIHYAEGDKLFVPITEIFRISKYLGENTVALTRLSGKEWEKTLEKTDEELQIIAENILETNARRALQSGRAFGKFPDLEAKFREDFPYDYTADQLQAIFDVYHDMEADAPMDRLLSGDVGFGKTEVAMNAAYKAVLSGVQVAVISPLVVLAMEHYESFCERLEKFGVKIALLSRMSKPKEAEEIFEKMRTGAVNIVIGTHRLLNENAKWKKL